MGTTGKRYDKDFKLSAIKMVIERGRSTNSVAADLRVSYDTLQRWLKEFKTDPQNSLAALQLGILDTFGIQASIQAE